jgi:DNA-binding transcriptional MocR family regulator
MHSFSTSALNMRSSEIRRLMKLAADPSIISFAGGMPNNNLFPCDVVEELYHALSLQEKQIAFQYGPTLGYPPLLDALKEYLRSRDLPVDTNDILITTGAQQAISILAKIFINPGDTIITEYPCFIGAVAAFQSHAATMLSIGLDDEGIIIHDLTRALESASPKPKILYLSPYFHNPAGIIYSARRKQTVIDLCKKHNIIMLEDDPYGELYFDDATRDLIRPMKSMANDASHICYVGTFAKILGPGMRLGYLLAPKEIIEKCELAKQSMDACSSTFTQVLARAFLSENKLGPYLAMLRPVYRRRAEIMLQALKEHMPDQITWTVPRGGFYIWVVMPETIDATDVFAKSLEKGAAFVIGSAFDPAGKRNNCFRLAFSHTPEERIAEGITIIADAVRECLAKD